MTDVVERLRPLVESHTVDETEMDPYGRFPGITFGTIRQAASLILSLQGEVEKAKADAELCAAEWTKEIEHGNALRARLQAALAALEPFALAKPSSFYDADGSECEGYSIHLTGTGKPDFTGADLAAARQALSPTGEPHEPK